MKTKKVYCSICDTANIETTETIEVFYCCSMCRENHPERNIKENTFNENLVIEYNS